ncbi:MULTISPECIES: hypothetical protein [Jannaschia]|nr:MULTISPECIES: hypothetical protein [unclassified Jannaschia]
MTTDPTPVAPADLARATELRPEGCTPAPDVPEAIAKRPPQTKSAAEWAYQRVVLYLKAFEENLSDDQDAAMAFTGGAAGVLRIQGIGFSAPDIVTFTGQDMQGQQCLQLLHVSQLNVMLRAVSKPPDQPEPLRIGFRLARALETEAENEDAAED